MELDFPIGVAPLEHDEAAAAELSISPALVSPFCEIALEYFSTFQADPHSHGSSKAALNAYLDRLCLDFEGIHGSNKIHFALRLHALCAMAMIGLPALMPRELWQTNLKGAITPSPALIRAAMLAPWPTIAVSSDSLDADVVARLTWNEFVHRCIACSVSPLGLSALATPTFTHLH